MPGTPKTAIFPKLLEKSRKNPRENPVHQERFLRFPGGGPGKWQKWPFFMIFSHFWSFLDPPRIPGNSPSSARKTRAVLCQKTANFDEKSSKITWFWPPKTLSGGWFIPINFSFLVPVSLVYRKSQPNDPFLDSPGPSKTLIFDPFLTHFWTPISGKFPFVLL